MLLVNNFEVTATISLMIRKVNLDIA
jgi:hypothetical protein